MEKVKSDKHLTKENNKAESIWGEKRQDAICIENDCVVNGTKNFSTIYSTDLLPTKNGEEPTKHFLLEVVNILLNYVKKSFDRSSKVLDFHYPHQLKEGLEGFSLDLPDQPENLEQVLVDCRDTLKYGVKTGHPRFFNQLSSGLDIIGLAGEWLTSAANTNIFTFEISPVFILMEEVLLKKMQEKIGWPAEERDGIFSPGGSISNLYSVLLARYHFFPEVKTKGMAAVPRLALFTSEHSHYSIRKAAAVLGIGTENVFMVKCDERGKMIPSELEFSILKAKVMGSVPFYVNATAGTTVYGAFDPLSEIADVCEKHNLWMHVDASWGGGLLMSKKHSVKLKGIERATSVTWNPHKMMGIPLQCSAILVRKKGLLQSCNQLCAEYLFQPDKHYDVSYDTGDKTIQCGRHVDAFKFWLMWKAKGTEGFEAQINKCLQNAQHFYNELKKRDDFELVYKSEPEHSNVCFWYIPPSLKQSPHGVERNMKLHEVAPKIKAKMMEEGTTMVGYQPLGENVNFFRCVFSNPATNKSDVDFLIEEIVRLGHDL
ncbi:glutamate decarboxylase 1 [Lepisosteus oculatus]|uniref:glutamate decarboxylase 1 n=1 Tax=Lepisosteus oculatus TaxID=7918 RepID=UPI00073FBACA|nr:PREDICTED: glutamate decarboxylase 1-like [Lepisosteus oculatus]